MLRALLFLLVLIGGSWFVFHYLSMKTVVTGPRDVPTKELSGQLLVDEELREHILRATVVTPERRDSSLDFARTSTIVRPDGDFSLSHIRAGEMFLIIHADQQDFHLFEMPLEDWSRDEPLDVGTIDLRGKLRQALLTLVGKERKNLNGLYAKSLDGTLLGYDRSNPLELVLPLKMMPAEVGAKGHRPVEKLDLLHKETIELKPGPEITISFPNLPYLPLEYVVQGRLTPEHLEDLEGWNPEVVWFTIERTGGHQIKVPKEGRYRLSIFVNHAEDKGSTFERSRRAEVSWTEQPVLPIDHTERQTFRQELDDMELQRLSKALRK